MLSKVEITFEAKWFESDGDASPCLVCDEPIYGKMHTLTIVIGEKKSETKVRLCRSCYEFSSESRPE